MAERTHEALQELVIAAPSAGAGYHSDGFEAYAALWYPAPHEVAPGKSQTYSVEGANADLRHYLARLGRRSRCFSRCLKALRRAVDLFVFCHNRRQRFKRAHPHLPAHLADFVAAP